MPCPYRDSANTLYNEPSDKVGVIKVLVKLSDKIKDTTPNKCLAFDISYTSTSSNLILFFLFKIRLFKFQENRK